MEETVQEPQKRCPHCQKLIHAMAKKCPYCRSDLRGPFERHPVAGLFLIVIVIAVIIAIVSAAIGSSNSSPNVAASQQNNNVVEATTTEAAPAPTLPQFNDGNYVVGTDIKPGTYRTREASTGCYYERLSGFGGTTDDIIANANTDAPAVVTILSTDKGFDSSNCGTWTEDLSAITNSSTTFGDGIFIVGTDIEPGTYRSSGESGCYYARLNGFGGTSDDIIANQNTDSSAIVTIAASDAGFQSSNCGTWTRMSTPTAPPSSSVKSAPASQSNNSTMATPPVVVKNNWASYSQVSFQSILDDPSYYLGQNVQITGIVQDFLGSGGRGGTENYVEIDDPNNPDASADRIMLQVDNAANYYTATQELNSLANVSLSGNLPDSAVAYGVVLANATFENSNGGEESLPVIDVVRLDKCINSFATCNMGTASIFPVGLSTQSTVASSLSATQSNPRYFQLNIAGACENDGNGTIILNGYPYSTGFSIPSADIDAWSGNEVAFTVPAGVIAGTYKVDIRGYEPGTGFCPDVTSESITVP